MGILVLICCVFEMNSFVVFGVGVVWFYLIVVIFVLGLLFDVVCYVYYEVVVVIVILILLGCWFEVCVKG